MSEPQQPLEQHPAPTEAAPPVPEQPGAGTEELRWRHVHPVTPAIRSWKTLVAIVAIIFWQSADDIYRARDVLAHGGLRWVFLALLAVVVVAGVYSYLAWRFTRFAVGERVVHLHTGVLFRQQRQAHLDRLQAVDVVRPLLARVAGLAQLTLEVAGATDSKVELAYLKEEEALALRAELLARAAGLTVEQSPEAPEPVVEEAPERTVLEVPPARLVGSILLSGTFLTFVVVMLAGIGAVVATAVGLIRNDGELVGNALVLLPVVVGFGSALWTRFNGGYGFTAAISPDGIRLRRGLLETRAQTIAPGRVQAIELVQPLLWRRTGWWLARVNVAGYGIDLQDDTPTTLLPVGDAEQARLAVWLVMPELADLELLSTAMEGTGPDGGVTLVPPRARILDPLTYRRKGYLVTDRALVVRTGRLRRVVQVVPHERTQSLGLSQGPIQRRLGLASLALHSVPGPVSPGIDHLDLDVARRLLAEQSVRAREARAHDRSERWMER